MNSVRSRSRHFYLNYRNIQVAVNPTGKGRSSFQHIFQVGSGATRSPTQSILESPSPGAQLPKREADHSPTFLLMSRMTDGDFMVCEGTLHSLTPKQCFNAEQHA